MCIRDSSNGFSLIRKILAVKELSNEQLIDEIMNPTRIYVKSILSLIETTTVNGMVHITGDNVQRFVQLDSVTGLAYIKTEDEIQGF